MNLCSALYHHTNIRNGGRVYPCCRFKTQLMQFDGDVDQILHSKEYNDLRERFKKGRISECSKCWDQEDKGIKSTRQYFNDQYDCDTIKLKNLWIGFDNICNLRCEPCGADWSNQFDGNVISTKSLSNVPKLEKIVFLGGEPLMNRRYLRFLESVDKQDLDLTIITNGMFKPTDQWKNSWRECKHVKFFVSIDGYKELNEEVRQGSKWDVIVDTVTELEKEWHVIINTVIHKKNLHGIYTLRDWVKNRSWQINLLTYPKHLRISLDEEQKITKEFHKYFDYPI